MFEHLTLDAPSDVDGYDQSEDSSDPRLDQITGLPSRAAMIQALKLPGGLIARHRMVVIVLGLDRFRLVNEVLGDVTGDELLRAVATRLRPWITDGRTVGRIGADEFALIGPCDSLFQATAMSEAVIGLMSTPFALSGWESPVHVSACLGVALTDAHDAERAHPLLQALRASTEALHDAKRRGPGSIEWFDEHRHHERESQFRLANDLPGAISREEFELVYQPIVTMQTVRPVGVEALLRWRHPELGLLMPGNFIPLLEATGLIHVLGEWVLRTACRQVAAWQERLPNATIPAVSVNVSASQFERPEFTETVARSLRTTGISPDRLVLELTEGTVLHDTVRAQVVLNELERIGVRVAIDDFGTGHSSLAYLKRLPVHILKIDRAFVANIDADHRDQAIVRAVVQLAHSLGMETIAEGVETRDQLVELRRLGCEQAQGFYWSPAVHPDDIEPWISGRMLSLAPREMTVVRSHADFDGVAADPGAGDDGSDSGA